MINEKIEIIEKICFDIVSGRLGSSGLQYPLAIGRATCHNGDSFYTLKIWMFYNQTFFLVRNHSDKMRYTIYAKKVQEDAGIKFLNPVGTGFIPENLKTHLELRFRFPHQSLYMSLYPVQS